MRVHAAGLACSIDYDFASIAAGARHGWHLVEDFAAVAKSDLQAAGVAASLNSHSGLVRSAAARNDFQAEGCCSVGADSPAERHMDFAAARDEAATERTRSCAEAQANKTLIARRAAHSLCHRTARLLHREKRIALEKSAS